MASRVVMPKLSDTMEEGVLLRWYKQEGENVESGDALAEIETDKAVMDLEAYASGKLIKVLAGEGDHVPAGGLIAVIGKEDEDIKPILQDPGQETVQSHVQSSAVGQSEIQQPVQPAPEPPAESTPEPLPLKEEKTGQLPKSSPLARRLASQMGLDLAKIKGTGPGGRITRADVEEAGGKKSPVRSPASCRPSAEKMPPKQVAPPLPVSGKGQEQPLSSIRRAIARKMVQSKAPVPHFYVTVRVKMNRALDFKDQLSQAWGENAPSITGLILKSCALSLGRMPELNASFAEDRIILHPAIHLGIAVGLEEGLIVPVLRHCEDKDLKQLAAASEELIARARTRKIRPEEYTGATFSVSNLGMFGVDSFIAVITPPEAAALAVGAVQEEPVLRDGRMVSEHFMKVTLSCDHRAVDGVQAARFLQLFRENLEQPVRLLAGDTD